MSVPGLDRVKLSLVLHRRWWLGVGAALLVAALVLPELAEARVGGGQSYGRRSGGGGFRGSGGYGGGGGDGGDLIVLLLYLVMRYPQLGVPVLIGVVIFFVVRTWVFSPPAGRQVRRTHHEGPYEPPPVRRAPRAPGLRELRERDPGFSMPVLQDFLVLVHRRALEAIGNGHWEALLPFVAPEGREALTKALPGVNRVSEVVVGGLAVRKVDQREGYDRLYVTIESTRLEGEARVLVEEAWVFRRAIGARSVPPERVERLGCPHCGASIEVTPMGTCRNCDSPITAGQLQWQAVYVRVLRREPAKPPEVGLWQGGDEPSVHVPMVESPDLAAAMRQLTTRHPSWNPAVFGERVTLVYTRLQQAWSDGEWSEARPYVTDFMYQTLRFWMERYRRAGLRNQLTDVKLERVRVVKIELDAWYEAVTVRIWGSMRDATLDADGRVIGGNPRVDRRFSEYWTFLRAAGTDGSTKGGADVCPSCGAPLDQVSQAGICGYCDSKITTGQFDWVLSRIDQPEAYAG